MSDALVVVCGLRAEERIIRRFTADLAEIAIIVGGGAQDRLAGELDVLASRSRGLVSFGIAGGLDPALQPGDRRVARDVVLPSGERIACDVAWATSASQRLGVPLATFAGVDRPLADVAGKAALRTATGAATVDMESHIVARAAQRHGLPFAAIRVVSDAAARELPPAARVGMRADGNVDLPAVLKSLVGNPRQLPALVRAGLDARAAFAALFRCRQDLGAGFAFIDLGQPLLHVT